MHSLAHKISVPLHFEAESILVGRLALRLVGHGGGTETPLPAAIVVTLPYHNMTGFASCLAFVAGAVLASVLPIVIRCPLDPRPVHEGLGEGSVLPPPNNLLRSVRHLAQGAVDGPETAVVGPNGSVWALEISGRITHLRTHDFSVPLRRIGVRPLGGALSRDGRSMYVADAVAGLLEVSLDTLESMIVCSEDEHGQPLQVRC